MKLDTAYWNQKYRTRQTGWDIGYVSTPIKEYIDQLEDKNLRIMVPGAGNAWEVEYLFWQGFRNTYLLDISDEAIRAFHNRVPDFPVRHLLNEDFFEHQGKYDLIIEQTFFSSLPRYLRPDYVRHMKHLLLPGGKLAGLLFNHEFGFDHPPFGGSPEEYLELFSEHFSISHFGIAYNSIKPRRDREHFVLLTRK
ncbi:MAG: SAM-dependent methyltransferase [Bacteroidota bacterium]|nr:SAM-dependent methyltransferase [Bacteroidota bacterium]